MMICMINNRGRLLQSMANHKVGSSDQGHTILNLYLYNQEFNNICSLESYIAQNNHFPTHRTSQNQPFSYKRNATSFDPKFKVYTKQIMFFSMFTCKSTHRLRKVKFVHNKSKYH